VYIDGIKGFMRWKFQPVTFDAAAKDAMDAIPNPNVAIFCWGEPFR
jgi:hypothetical protein